MAKNIVSRVDRNLARRLREARKETGMSTRAVAERLPRRLAVSHATIASYENGTTVPAIDILAAFADIYGRTLTWFLDNRESLTSFRYRNLGSRVRLSEQRQFEALAGKWADAYVQLDRHLKARQRNPAAGSLVVEDRHSPVTLADTVRKSLLNINDDQPVQSVVQVLEMLEAWTLELKTSLGIDSAAARRGDDVVIILNPDIAHERIRMNAAHEVAHLLYHDCKERLGWSDEGIEKQAYLFATSLLLPHSQLLAAFEGKSFLKLIQYKERFGISLAAMIYRAEQLRIINTTASRWLWSEMARRGWRANEPGNVWRDRAINFETMLECAVQSKTFTWLDAERITGIRETELRERLAGAMQSDHSSAQGGETEEHAILFETLRVPEYRDSV